MSKLAYLETHSLELADEIKCDWVIQMLNNFLYDPVLNRLEIDPTTQEFKTDWSVVKEQMEGAISHLEIDGPDKDIPWDVGRPKFDQTPVAVAVGQQVMVAGEVDDDYDEAIIAMAARGYGGRGPRRPNSSERVCAFHREANLAPCQKPNCAMKHITPDPAECDDADYLKGLRCSKWATCTKQQPKR